LGIGATRDHEPIPVRMEEIENPFHMCDFCACEEVVCYFTGGQESEFTYDYVAPTGETENVTMTQSWRKFGRRARVEHGLGVVTGGLDATTSELWTACEACAKVVERGSMSRLISHVKAIYAADPERKHRNPTRQALETLYEGLFRNLNRERIPL